MKRYRIVYVAIALLAAGAASLGMAAARDQDAARAAVQRGDIRPLTDLLATLQGKLPGEIVKVEIDRKDSRWIYEFRVVDKTGRIFEVYVDAATGDIRRIKEK